MPNYALEGPKWSSNTITWSFAQANYSGQPAQFGSFYGPGEFANEIQAAFGRWASVADLHFVQTTDSPNVDIRLGLATFDGQYGTLGQADYQYRVTESTFVPGVTVRFDSAENYSYVNGREQLSGGITFQSVALHEIGHALGLDHYSASPAIMSPTASSSVTDLTQSDVDGIRALYGEVMSYQFTSGSDVYSGSDFSQTLRAFGGDDTVRGQGGNDIIYGNLGADVIYGNLGRDSLFGGQDSDRLYGGQGADAVYGNLGDDIVYGNLGNDALYGGQGRDILYGGRDDDILFGNLGDDTLIGGLGADRYVFGPNSGADLILGFSQGDGDRLAFNGQSYNFADDGQGGTLFTLSGGGTVDVAGVQPNQVNSGFFA